MRTTPSFVSGFRPGLALAALLGLTACYLDDGAVAYDDMAGGPSFVAGSGIVVRSNRDFYGPLGPYGTWELIDGYGECWVPASVGPDWRPYEDGMWVSTDAGWYWRSDEPWGWATYHYGRWRDDPAVGWCWVPGTQWAPAWVLWCDQGDIIGWAPLPPQRGFWAGTFAGRREDDDERHFVFVPRREFQHHLRREDEDRYRSEVARRFGPSLRIAVTHNAPNRAVIAQASGHPVRTVPAQVLRRRRDAVVESNAPRPELFGAVSPAPPEGSESRRPPPEAAPSANDRRPPERPRPSPVAASAPPRRAPERAERRAEESHAPPPSAAPREPEMRPLPRATPQVMQTPAPPREAHRPPPPPAHEHPRERREDKERRDDQP